MAVFSKHICDEYSLNPISRVNVHNNAKQQFTLFSYNSQGFAVEKVKFMKDLFVGCNAAIISIQEHLLLKENFYKLEQAFDDYHSYFIPAAKSNDNISRGRPSGGIATLWRKNVQNRAEPSKILKLNSSRVQGTVFHLLTGQDILYINCYFPSNKRNFDEHELLKTLDEITWLLDNSEYNHVVISGDINTDFSKEDDYIKIVRERCQILGVKTAWNSFQVDYTYTVSYTHLTLPTKRIV